MVIVIAIFGIVAAVAEGTDQVVVVVLGSRCHRKSSELQCVGVHTGLGIEEVIRE